MTSKKKINSPFRKTFTFGVIFFSFFGLLVMFFVIGGINAYIDNHPQKSSSVKDVSKEKPVDAPEKPSKPDTVYVQKLVFEKCNKKHCEDEISTLSSPIEPERQHDSTTN